jgi:hypothetical protein
MKTVKSILRWANNQPFIYGFPLYVAAGFDFTIGEMGSGSPTLYLSGIILYAVVGVATAILRRAARRCLKGSQVRGENLFGILLNDFFFDRFSYVNVISFSYAVT